MNRALAVTLSWLVACGPPGAGRAAESPAPARPSLAAAPMPPPEPVLDDLPLRVARAGGAVTAGAGLGWLGYAVFFGGPFIWPAALLFFGGLTLYGSQGALRAPPPPPAAPPPEPPPPAAPGA